MDGAVGGAVGGASGRGLAPIADRISSRLERIAECCSGVTLDGALAVARLRDDALRGEIALLSPLV